MKGEDAKVAGGLTAGIWAAVPTPWTESGAFDENAFVHFLRQYARAGVEGVYTTDSTGEFYSIEFDEFRRITDLMVETCKSLNLKTGSGCTWTHTAGVVQRLEYAAARKVDAAHVALPFWMPMSEGSRAQFWRRVGDVPTLPVVHYNTRWSYSVYGAADYPRILELAPNLAAVKWTTRDIGGVAELRSAVPQLAIYVSEEIFTPAMALGAAGCCSAVVNMNPGFMLEWYGWCRRGAWPQAYERQCRLARFYLDVLKPIEKAGHLHAVIDKGMAAASGFLNCSPRTREPYLPLDESEIERIRCGVDRLIPELRWRDGPVPASEASQ